MGFGALNASKIYFVKQQIHYTVTCEAFSASVLFKKNIRTEVAAKNHNNDGTGKS